jgi:CDP-diacylglycerol--glycerol-3-phosphate 3-phosphatidyltransferase
MKKSDPYRQTNKAKCALFKPKNPHSVYSEASIITLLRFCLSLVFYILAIQKMSLTYCFIGLVIHWAGDLLDGFYARKFKQETILGAEIDIIADRVEVLFFYIIFLFFRPHLFLPAALYIIDFAFVDFYLSFQFLKFDIISPNYFYKVDGTVHRLNFSLLGKFSNSSVVTLILIFLPQFQVVATVWAAGLIGVKTYSIHRLHRKSRTHTR